MCDRVGSLEGFSMRRLSFIATVLLSATLLFFVQPLAGKILLPVLGGSPAVWNTCMLFFQATLLAGYCYVDLIDRRLSLPAQVGIHAGLLAVAGAFLPFATQVSIPDESPVPWLIKSLACTVGPPFFALCATAPLLQRWFSQTRDPQAADPYFLYAASNAGSIFGLLAYPLLVEPTLPRGGQSLLFAAGYGVAAFAVTACGLIALAQTNGPQPAAAASLKPAQSMPRSRLIIIALAAVPSSLVLGVTQHLTSDVAALPLLWVVPLAVYLGTFMLAFSRWPPVAADGWGSLLPSAAMPALFFLVTGIHHPLWLILGAHLGLLFVAGAMCHKRLYELRPPPARLTEFYLLTSLGGVLGGAFNALVAPLIFSGIVVYPLAIALAFWLRPQAEQEGSSAKPHRMHRVAGLALAALVGAGLTLGADAVLHTGIIATAGDSSTANWFPPIIRAGPALAIILGLAACRLPRAAATAVTAAMLALPFTGLGGQLLFQGRSFFGVHRVVLHPSESFTLLRHGSTIHGVQARRREGSETLAALSREPTTYYARSGPLGDVIGLLGDEKRLQSVAVIGLGAGTIAAYATPGMAIDFFEIDPLVVQIAADRRLFTYLADAAAEHRGQLRGTVGDGRLRLAERPAHAYDLVIIDAFASDAIPLHLVTREAVAMYAERLRPGGLVAFNVSNRYFDLAPPIGGIAADLGLAAAVRRDIDIPPAERERAKKESVWVAVGGPAEIASLQRRQPGWEPIPLRPGADVWTDDYANLLGVFNGW